MISAILRCYYHMQMMKTRMQIDLCVLQSVAKGTRIIWLFIYLNSNRINQPIQMKGGAKNSTESR